MDSKRIKFGISEAQTNGWSLEVFSENGMKESFNFRKLRNMLKFISRNGIAINDIDESRYMDNQLLTLNVVRNVESALRENIIFDVRLKNGAIIKDCIVVNIDYPTYHIFRSIEVFLIHADTSRCKMNFKAFELSDILLKEKPAKEFKEDDFFCEHNECRLKVDGEIHCSECGVRICAITSDAMSELDALEETLSKTEWYKPSSIIEWFQRTISTMEK